jgi:hypothetical protein
MLPLPQSASPVPAQAVQHAPRVRYQPGTVRVIEGEREATVPCVRHPQLPGAALHRMLDGRHWALTHERSGLAIRAQLTTQRQGRQLMDLLAGHSFDRDQGAVIRNDRLTADLLGYASQVCGEHLYIRDADGTWTLNVNP